MNKPLPVLDRKTAEPLIRTGKLVPAYLYDTRYHGCVWVQLSKDLKRVYRVTKS